MKEVYRTKKPELAVDFLLSMRMGCYVMVRKTAGGLKFYGNEVEDLAKGRRKKR